MTYNELLALLEIESPKEFAYFEHLAELLESAEEIEEAHFHTLLSAIPLPNLAELVEQYFEDILQGIPDDALDFYTLMTNIKNGVGGLCQGEDSLETRRQVAGELCRFRDWYALENGVLCRSQKDGIQTCVSICEALALYRLEKLGEEAYDYDFEGCSEYPLDEYVMTFAIDSMKSREDSFSYDGEDDLEAGDASGCSCGHHDGLEALDTLIDPINPVIDGDYSDQREEY